MHWYLIIKIAAMAVTVLVALPVAVIVALIAYRMAVTPYCPLCKSRKNTYRIGIAGILGDEVCDIHGDIDNLEVSSGTSLKEGSA